MKEYAGISKNAAGFAAVTNPLVNSYKRLVPGYEAPVYVACRSRIAITDWEIKRYLSNY